MWDSQTFSYALPPGAMSDQDFGYGAAITAVHQSNTSDQVKFLVC